MGSIAPKKSALLTLSGLGGPYVIQTNGIIRPVKCPRGRMTFSVRAPHRSMPFVTSCSVLTGDESSVPPGSRAIRKRRWWQIGIRRSWTVYGVTIEVDYAQGLMVALSRNPTSQAVGEPSQTLGSKLRTTPHQIAASTASRMQCQPPERHPPLHLTLTLVSVCGAVSRTGATSDQATGADWQRWLLPRSQLPSIDSPHLLC